VNALKLTMLFVVVVMGVIMVLAVILVATSVVKKDILLGNVQKVMV